MNLTRTIIIGLTTAFCCAAPVGAQSSCPGDLNLNGEVNGEDLGILLAAWGPCVTGPPVCRGDLDGSGTVDGDDLGLLLANWGCPTLVPAWATLIEALPDPSVVSDPKLRADIIASRFAWRVRHTATQIEMLLVPPGTFIMGCTVEPCQPNVPPPHQVQITRPFYLGRFEVTQAQFLSITGTNPAIFRDLPDSANRPVENISGNGSPLFLQASGMRLPTAAEWEFACRAGTSSRYYDGSNDGSDILNIAWLVENSGPFDANGRPTYGPHPVGTKLPNRLGFHDMVGNVWEVVQDYYVHLPCLAGSCPQFGDQVDPCFCGSPPLCCSSIRQCRGGGWNSPSWTWALFPWHADWAAGAAGCCINASNSTIGVRVAKDP